MSFIIYDLVLLVIFISLISIFLYKNKKNLKRDGLLILYRTSWGLKLIEKTGNKNPRLMKFLSYASIITGYLLMVGGIYFFAKVIWIYISRADVVAAVKVPPIMPLIPYLPQMFKLSWLPDFYFTYWIVILAIIAVSHEFAHGIFSAYHKIKIKTTGFGFFPYFLPVFLAAFVELDEKKMEKKTTSSSISILCIQRGGRPPEQPTILHVYTQSSMLKNAPHRLLALFSFSAGREDVDQFGSDEPPSCQVSYLHSKRSKNSPKDHSAKCLDLDLPMNGNVMIPTS